MKALLSTGTAELPTASDPLKHLAPTDPVGQQAAGQPPGGGAGRCNRDVGRGPVAAARNGDLVAEDTRLWVQRQRELLATAP